jgi:hypothetical protein
MFDFSSPPHDDVWFCPQVLEEDQSHPLVLTKSAQEEIQSVDSSIDALFLRGPQSFA